MGGLAVGARLEFRVGIKGSAVQLRSSGYIPIYEQVIEAA